MHYTTFKLYTEQYTHIENITVITINIEYIMKLLSNKLASKNEMNI